MLHSGASVFGDEQVLDVELDRNTMFRPVTKPTQDAEPWNSYYSSPRVQADPVPALPGGSASHLLGFNWSSLKRSFVRFSFSQDMLFFFGHLFRSFR